MTVFVIDETTPKIAIPDGYFVCFPTGQRDSCTGFGIFSKDGKYASWDDLVSMTEYNSTFEIIQTVGFKKGSDDYVVAIRFEDGDIIQD